MRDYKFQYTKNRLRSLIKNNDNKVLLENFAALTLLQIAGYVFPIFTLPYLARIIGVDKFGEIAFASAVIIYFQTLVDYGFNFSATREIAKCRNDLNKVSEIFSAVMWSKIFLMVLSFLLLIVLIIVVPKFYNSRILLLISFCLIPGRIFFPEWLFQGLEKMKFITILNVIAKLVFTILVFVFINEKSDYFLHPLLISCGFILSGSIAMFIIYFRYKIVFLCPSFSSIRLMIKQNFDIFLNQLLPNLYNSFSILLVSFWGGAIATGIFDAGSKFSGISYQFLSALSRAFFPYLSRKSNKHFVYLWLNLAISCIVSIALFLLAPFVIRLFFTVEFLNSIAVLRILSVSIIFLALINIYGTNFLIIQKYEKELRNITILSSIIGFLCAWPLIYYYSYFGAAITITITRGIMAFFITIKAIQIKKSLKYNHIELNT